MVERASILLPKIAAGLRRVARSSGGSASSLNELEARIVVELLLFGPVTMTSLVEILGNEKAQVSRTVAAMLNMGLVGRQSLRSAIVLTSAGDAMARTIVAKARDDTAQMFSGVSAREAEALAAALPRLWGAAYTLLAREAELNGKARGTALPRIDARLMQQTTTLDLLTLRIATVGTLLQRSFFLTCRRLNDLAASELATLTHVLEYGPVTGKDLARLEGRPKAQTDRTAYSLEGAGFLTRSRALDSHDWIYEVSTRDAVGMQLRCELDRREAFLLQGVSPSQAKVIVSILQRVFAQIGSRATSLA
jgi:DNA-binding MarR family transcriptional regulator